MGTDHREETPVGSRFDEAKGRVKEAAGDVTGRDDLEREGKRDQVGAKIKEVAEEAKAKVGHAVDSVKKKLSSD